MRGINHKLQRFYYQERDFMRLGPYVKKSCQLVKRGLPKGMFEVRIQGDFIAADKSGAKSLVDESGANITFFPNRQVRTPQR